MRVIMTVTFDEAQVDLEKAEEMAREVVFVSEMTIRQLLDRRNHTVDMEIEARVED